MSFRSFLLLFAVFAGLSTPSWGQRYRSSSVADSTARRFGLQKMWNTQIELDRSRGRVKYLTQHVSSTDAKTVYEITYKGGKTTISPTDLDEFGDPIGPELAKKMATQKKATLEAYKLEPEMKEIAVPDILLFAITDQALIHAIDAETGRTRWKAAVGSRRFPTLDVGANDKYVATVNGSSIYVFERNSGKEVWARMAKGVPGAGPALSDDLVHVPMLTGKMESYALDDYRRAPKIYQSFGKAIIQPSMSSRSLAWPTDRGFLYVGSANQAYSNLHGVRYRLVALDSITSKAVFFPPASWFVSSLDGYLYHVREMSGDLIWRFSTGEPIGQSPMVIEDMVFVITDRGGLFALSMEDGREKWWIPGVARFIGGSKDRLYVLGTTGRLTIIDRKTGGRIGSLPTEALDLEYVNLQTDRLFVGTRTGQLQCLREIRNEFPIVHAFEEAAKKKDQQKPPAVIQQGVGDQPAVPNGDPFGAGAGGGDPFGAGAGGGDPFGAGGGAGGGNADPFGAGGGAGGGNVDPFGAGGGAGGMNNAGGGMNNADPFGADPFGN